MVCVNWTNWTAPARSIAAAAGARLAEGRVVATTLAFTSGNFFLLWLPRLPDPACSQWLPVALLGLTHRRSRFVCALAAGFLWAGLRASAVALDGLDPALAGIDVVVEGKISGLVTVSGGRNRFEFEIESARAGGTFADPDRFPRRVRLSWRTDAIAPAAGERWRLRVRLKRPRGFSNPGGFDYERWLFVRGLRATGYVKAQTSRGDRVNVRLTAAPRSSLVRLRAQVGARLTALASAGHTGREGWIRALVVGDRSGIDQDDWRVLRRTGTAHLMAISGLHVGLAAGFGAGAVRLLWWLWMRLLGGRSASLSPGTAGRLTARLTIGVTRLMPAATGASALACAVAYAALAGFSVSTRRALVMVSVGVLVVVLKRAPAPSAALALALLAVLAAEPLAPLETGFWLSFLAVALIVFGLSRRPSAAAPSGTSRVRRWPALALTWGRMQCLIALGTLPVAVALFGQHPLVAPVANAFTVPWVSALVVPPLLAATLLLEPWPLAAAALVEVALTAISLVWPLLDWLARTAPLIHAPTAPAPWVIAAGLLGGFALLAPRGLRLRLPAVALLATSALPPLVRPDEGGVRLTVLDVGQGLAVVARTRSATLVYDTGPGYGEGFNAGSAAVWPYLQHIGADHIDVLVLSHANRDHTGGARWLVSNIRVDRVIGTLPEAAAAAWDGRAVHCVAGLAFVLDGVRFEVLHPSASERTRAFSPSDNDASCVLSIEAGRARALLTGDIERRAEAALARRYGARLEADVMTVPHHGSATSSSPLLLDAVAPDIAVVSAGEGNRYGFPRPEVIQRYGRRGARLLSTQGSGAVSLSLRPEGQVEVDWRYRPDRGRFWHRLSR